MKTETERVYLFGCEYEDGGEWYYIEVDMVCAARWYYRCRINTIPGSILMVDAAGRLRRTSCDQVVIDVTTDDNDQWIDLDFGNYPLVDKLGHLIEKHTR